MRLSVCVSVTKMCHISVHIFVLPPCAFLRSPSLCISLLPPCVFSLPHKVNGTMGHWDSRTLRLQDTGTLGHRDSGWSATMLWFLRFDPNIVHVISIIYFGGWGGGHNHPFLDTIENHGLSASLLAGILFGCPSLIRGRGHIELFTAKPLLYKIPA